MGGTKQRSSTKTATPARFAGFRFPRPLSLALRPSLPAYLPWSLYEPPKASIWHARPRLVSEKSIQTTRASSVQRRISD
jgi:hypothetical protein